VDLVLERLVRIHPGPGSTVRVAYVCDCKGDAEVEAVYRYSAVILKDLIGTTTVPWYSLFAPRIVDDDDSDVVLWRWELDQLKGWDELVEWLDLTG
jgi:hypothetical protein